MVLRPIEELSEDEQGKLVRLYSSLDDSFVGYVVKVTDKKVTLTQSNPLNEVNSLEYPLLTQLLVPLRRVPYRRRELRFYEVMRNPVTPEEACRRRLGIRQG